MSADSTYIFFRFVSFRFEKIIIWTTTEKIAQLIIVENTKNFDTKNKKSQLNKTIKKNRAEKVYIFIVCVGLVDTKKKKENEKLNIEKTTY